MDGSATAWTRCMKTLDCSQRELDDVRRLMDEYATDGQIYNRHRWRHELDNPRRLTAPCKEIDGDVTIDNGADRSAIQKLDGVVARRLVIFFLYYFDNKLNIM